MEENMHTSQDVNQNQDATPSVVVDKPKNKNSKGLIALVIIFALLAIGGIGFGIYEIMDANNKSSEISSLKTQVGDKDEKITTLENEKNEIADKYNELVANTTTTGDANTTSTTSNPEPAATVQAPTTSSTKDSDVILENVLEFGTCVGDQAAGAPEGEMISVKCSVTTTDGSGTLFYTSGSKTLRFILKK
jgi:uncharacterized protein HemX